VDKGVIATVQIVPTRPVACSAQHCSAAVIKGPFGRAGCSSAIRSIQYKPEALVERDQATTGTHATVWGHDNQLSRRQRARCPGDRQYYQVIQTIAHSLLPRTHP